MDNIKWRVPNDGKSKTTMTAEDKFRAMLARLDKEPSRAMEQHRYGNPANHIKFEGERRLSMNEQELNAYCEAWVRWCMTRKYFIKPGSQNTLARMQPSKVGREPDAQMSDGLSWFNMAVHALADMGEHKEDAECFVKFYCDRASNIKAVANELKIGTRTFYDRKARFARKALSMASSLKNAFAASREADQGKAVDLD